MTPGLIPPSDPRTDNIFPRKIDLRWTDNSDNETGFRVAISRNGGRTWDNVGVTGAGVSHLRVEGLEPGTSYQFKVRAARGKVYSDYSPVLEVTTDSGRPAPPTELGTRNVWARTVHLKWTDNSRSEDRFEVQMRRDGTGWEPAVTTGRDDADERVGDLRPATTYWFRVRAVNDEYGASGWSESLAVTTVAPPTPPGNIRTSDIWARRIDVRWTDASDNEDGFVVQISTDGRHFRKYAEKKPNDQGQKVTNLDANTVYWFRVVAYNEAGETASEAFHVRTKKK